jgi:hypothetical protein
MTREVRVGDTSSIGLIPRAPSNGLIDDEPPQNPLEMLLPIEPTNPILMCVFLLFKCAQQKQKEK